MKKIYKFVALAALFSACNVLDQEPQSQITGDIIFSSKKGVDAAVLGLYNFLQSDNMYGANIPFATDQYADVTRMGGFFDEWLQLDNKSLPANNFVVRTIWSGAYATINLANIIIAQTPTVDDAGFSEGERAKAIATAKAVRALCYFDLLRHYGEWWNSSSQYGVPVIIESSGGDLANVTLKARDNVGVVWNQIKTDLDEAYDVFTEDDNDSKFLITKGFIDGMYARYYLYTGDYTSAINVCTDIIDNGGYNLMSYYGNAFVADETQEDIFKLSFNAQDQSSLATYTIGREEVLPEDALINKLQENANDERLDLLGTAGSSPITRILKYPDGANNTDPAIIMRLAEIFLIRAEAYIQRGQAGDDVLALGDINAIRLRSELGIGTPANATELEELYLDETLREMFGESYRYFALVRLGRTADVLDLADFRRIFPIPQPELNIAGTPIVQNPGYVQ